MGRTLDQLLLEVFANPENGKPDDISPAGCLALAKLGKDVWNAWHQKYPAYSIDTDKGTVWKNKTNFSGVNFDAINKDSKNGIQLAIDFSGFKFREYADFSNAIFSNRTIFNGAQFDGYVSFKNAIFEEKSYFDNVYFKGLVDFHEVMFKGKSIFRGARFDDISNFCGTQFLSDANFTGAQFYKNTLFVESKFLKEVSFKGAQFGALATFDGVSFHSDANFSAIDWAWLINANAYQDINETKKWAEEHGLNPDCFRDVSFKGAFFGGEANFSGRLFTGVTSFSTLSIGSYRDQPVKFRKVPLFHNCKLSQDISFDGALFPKPNSESSFDDDAIRAYRTLKLAFAQQQAFREEQKFFRLELAEEENRSSQKQRWLFFVYRWISDYGFSLSRPAFILLASPLLFTFLYAMLSGLRPCFSWAEDCQINFHLVQYSILQSLPLPGFEKWSNDLKEHLFARLQGWNIVFLPLIIMIHKGISLIAIFLLGLALRNLFKMK